MTLYDFDDDLSYFISFDDNLNYQFIALFTRILTKNVYFCTSGFHTH